MKLTFNQAVSLSVDNIYVKYYIFDSNKPLMFTFANADLKEQRCTLSSNAVARGASPWAYDIMKAKGLNVISFASIGVASWYRSQTFYDFVLELTEALKDFPVRLGYGDSMGAFGAAAFSNILQIDRLLLLYPISTLNVNVVPWVKGYEFARKSYEWESGCFDAADSNSRGIIFYDPLTMGDRKHEERFSSQFQRVRCPGLGHGFIGTLNEMGILKKLLDDFIMDEVNVQSLQKLCNIKRRSTKRYVDIMKQKKMSGWKRLVLEKHEENLLIRRLEPKVFQNKIVDFIQAGELDKAVALSGIVDWPNEHADVYRDQAIFFESCDLAGAMKLMSIAHKIRPDGRYIIKKIKQYKQLLLN